jgi:hypothetical protein
VATKLDRIAKLIYDRTQLVQMDAEDLAWDILDELEIDEEEEA